MDNRSSERRRYLLKHVAQELHWARGHRGYLEDCDNVDYKNCFQEVDEWYKELYTIENGRLTYKEG